MTKKYEKLPSRWRVNKLLSARTLTGTIDMCKQKRSRSECFLVWYQLRICSLSNIWTPSNVCALNLEKWTLCLPKCLLKFDQLRNEFFEKVDVEKILQTAEKNAKLLPSRQRVNIVPYYPTLFSYHSSGYNWSGYSSVDPDQIWHL